MCGWYSGYVAYVMHHGRCAHEEHIFSLLLPCVVYEGVYSYMYVDNFSDAFALSCCVTLGQNKTLRLGSQMTQHLHVLMFVQKSSLRLAAVAK